MAPLSRTTAGTITDSDCSVAPLAKPTENLAANRFRVDLLNAALFYVILTGVM